MQLLLVSGSTRANSTNGAALQCVQRTAPPGSVAVTYRGLSGLPAFNPDDDHERPPAVVEHLRRAIAEADAVLISTPEYAGTLPGSLKNLLDWTVGSTELTDKPVAWINVAAAGRGRGAIATLELVLGYVGAKLISDACLTVPVSRDALGPDGALMDGDAAVRLGGLWQVVSEQFRASDETGDT